MPSSRGIIPTQFLELLAVKGGAGNGTAFSAAAPC
jgi:hypothetical protein